MISRKTSTNVRKTKKKLKNRNGSDSHDKEDVENQCEVEDSKYTKRQYQRYRFITTLLVGGITIAFALYFLYIYSFNIKVTAGKDEEHAPIEKQANLEKEKNIHPKREQKHSSTSHYRWSSPKLLPPLPDEDIRTSEMMKTLSNSNGAMRQDGRKNRRDILGRNQGFRKHYDQRIMEWEKDEERFENDHSGELRKGPFVDYTNHEYEYIDVMYKLPPVASDYPELFPLGQLMKEWPQDGIDNPPKKITERLLHFDYMDPKQRDAAIKFRDSELPFKVYNVPELKIAGEKWTDEYLTNHFDHIHDVRGGCQESVDNFFAFFRRESWNIESMGPPPTLEINWNFERWAKHARFADNVRLDPSEKHYYWQAGIPKQERLANPKKWSFVSKDLPSFSNPEPTFFGFNPPEQKGIQCRFGERGVTAATHYDAGRNMVAMITGAKRYILSPPKECPSLGIIAERRHPAFRHSLLNFGHLNLLNESSDEAKEMPDQERSWLNLSNDSMAIETVLKAGEVLYIPSHWFHYIVSLQKSAQCNTRSGQNIEGTPEFGGYQDVMDCVGEGG